MQEILKAFSFETQIAFLKTSSETFAMGLKNSLKQKIWKSVFLKQSLFTQHVPLDRWKANFEILIESFSADKSKIFHTLSEKKFKRLEEDNGKKFVLQKRL